MGHAQNKKLFFLRNKKADPKLPKPFYLTKYVLAEL